MSMRCVSLQNRRKAAFDGAQTALYRISWLGYNGLNIDLTGIIKNVISVAKVT